jgi:hypothetical protein
VVNPETVVSASQFGIVELLSAPADQVAALLAFGMRAETARSSFEASRTAARPLDRSRVRKYPLEKSPTGRAFEGGSVARCPTGPRRRNRTAAHGHAMKTFCNARPDRCSEAIGYLSNLSSRYIAPPFCQGLKESGSTEGQNVAIERRSAEGQYDRLPSLVADLVDCKAAVIVAAGGTDPAKALAVRQDVFPRYGTTTKRSISPLKYACRNAG